MAQFGASALPAAGRKNWPTIKDDPVRHKNVRGTITFATSGRNSRTTQL